MRCRSLSLLAFTLVAAGCQQAPRIGYVEQQPVPIEYVDQTYHHRYGIEVPEDHWYKSGCSGQVVTTLRDGITVSQTFSNGMLNGEASYTYPNNTQIERKEFYKDDIVVSEIHYGPSGSPKYSKEYSSPDIWVETHWYESGQPRSTEKLERGLLINGEYYTTDHQKDSWIYDGAGERISRDDWGNFVSVDAFRGGELASITTRHSNGSIHEITPYAEGRIHGDRKSYYPGGDPMSIETWLHGEKTGTTQIFQNGEKYADVPYVRGKKQGIERRYKDGSLLSQEISWTDDKMNGPTHTYVGDSVQTDWFYRGRSTSRANFDSFALPKRPLPGN